LEANERRTCNLQPVTCNWRQPATCNLQPATRASCNHQLPII
jgi:hypothetical protein